MCIHNENIDILNLSIAIHNWNKHIHNWNTNFHNCILDVHNWIMDTHTVWKIGRNHGWSNGPPMVALWVVRSILGGPLKIRVNPKLLHRWHMDFKMFSFVDYTLLCWKLILNKIKASWKTLGTKKSWSHNGPPWRTSRSPGWFIGRLGRPGDLLFYTLPITELLSHTAYQEWLYVFVQVCTRCCRRRRRRRPQTFVNAITSEQLFGFFHFSPVD